MGCRDIRETISACVDGEASPEEAALVREHLASCERCRVLERQMRAVGAGVRQVRGRVPDRFREEVFARLESEGALPPRRKSFPVAWRWAAVPLAAAAAAALGFFLLTPGDGIRERATPGTATARMESPVSSTPLTTEDREMIALLDLLEDPAAFDANDDAEGMELLAPGDSADSPNPPRGGRSGA
ncbi:MAG: anti-sigma factor [bacterium]